MSLCGEKLPAQPGKEREALATWLTQLLSMVSAGAMLVSTSLDTLAPQHNQKGLLFLINRQWRVSETFEPSLRMADVPGQLRRMREDASYALEEMFAACKMETGIRLETVSGYRSYQKQENIYNNKLRSVGTEEKADEYVARPGASEHQMGLAMDVSQDSDMVNLTSAFGRTRGGLWIRENCWRFGFILRYDEGWEDVTGYEYEPWHVRYVGKEYAARLHESPMPLETFLILHRTETMLDLLVREK
ncbi:MAG: D-alanyl-D-alanine carboxypeptidase family protein [Clostridiales bacterium]|nr:D-alanyl-D-alanine carboxypeptidase family protein [Clostridiales bacterium]